MMLDEFQSKVYIRVDEHDRIVVCDGGYTTPEDLTGWIYLDAGEGDKYNLCQSHYFEGGLFTEDGIPLYKWKDGMVISRTTDEIAADFVKLHTTAKVEGGRDVQNSNR